MHRGRLQWNIHAQRGPQTPPEEAAGCFQRTCGTRGEERRAEARSRCSSSTTLSAAAGRSNRKVIKSSNGGIHSALGYVTCVCACMVLMMHIHFTICKNRNLFLFFFLPPTTHVAIRAYLFCWSCTSEQSTLWCAGTLCRRLKRNPGGWLPLVFIAVDPPECANVFWRRLLSLNTSTRTQGSVVPKKKKKSGIRSNFQKKKKKVRGTSLQW